MSRMQGLISMWGVQIHHAVVPSSRVQTRTSMQERTRLYHWAMMFRTLMLIYALQKVVEYRYCASARTPCLLCFYCLGGWFSNFLLFSAPLSDPLVMAETLGVHKSSETPQKVKDSQKQYLFKRINEGGVFGQVESSSSSGCGGSRKEILYTMSNEKSAAWDC